MPEVNENEDLERSTTADKVSAALKVLEAVDEMRIARERSLLREAMRQTAMTTLERACADAHDLEAAPRRSH